jgi:hypothetical protein
MRMRDETADLFRRIEALERDAKRWKRIGVGVLFVTVLVGMAGTAVAGNQSLSVASVAADSIITARLIAHQVDVDQDLVVGGKLKVSEIQTQTVVLTTPNGKRIGMIGGVLGERELVFFDDSGKQQVVLKAVDDGSSLLLTAPNAPTTLVRASTFGRNESAGISIANKAGKTRAELSLFGADDDAGGSAASMKLSDANHHAYASIDQSEHGGVLSLNGEDGAARLGTWGFSPKLGLAINDRKTSRQMTFGFDADDRD